MEEAEIEACRGAVLRVFPELADAAFQLLARGWDSTAVEALPPQGPTLVFKFPRHAEGEQRLRREALLLRVVRPGVSLPVPAMTLHEGPPLFSRHEKLPGASLTSADYAALPEPARRVLGETLGRFYAELHRLDQDRLTAAGATAVEAWETEEAIRAEALPLLEAPLRAFAEEVLTAAAALPPDPEGRIYGFFDGHGWNLAFDHAAARLTGVFDFGDSGFGPLHREFVYSGFVSAELTAGIVTAYEAETGRALDRRRIALLTAYHRLSELAELAHEPEQLPAALHFLADWAAQHHLLADAA